MTPSAEVGEQSIRVMASKGTAFTASVIRVPTKIRVEK